MGCCTGSSGDRGRGPVLTNNRLDGLLCSEVVPREIKSEGDFTNFFPLPLNEEGILYGSVALEVSWSRLAAPPHVMGSIGYVPSTALVIKKTLLGHKKTKRPPRNSYYLVAVLLRAFWNYFCPAI